MTPPEVQVETSGDQDGLCVPHESVTSVTSVTKVKDTLQNSSEIEDSSEVVKESVTDVTHVTDHTHTHPPENVPPEHEVKPPEGAGYDDLIVFWDLPKAMDISEHYKMRSKNFRCFAKGCEYSGDEFWIKAGGLPHPLCDHHYQELKRVKK